MFLLRWLLGVVVLFSMVGVGALFTLQNTTPVPLDLLVIQLPERTVAMWVMLSLVIGAGLGLAAGAFLLVSQRARITSLRRQKERLNLEIDRLRKVGLAESE